MTDDDYNDCHERAEAMEMAQDRMDEERAEWQAQLDAKDRRIAELEAELQGWKSPCVDVGSEKPGWICPTCKDPKCGL